MTIKEFIELLEKLPNKNRNIHLYDMTDDTTYEIIEIDDAYDVYIRFE